MARARALVHIYDAKLSPGSFLGFKKMVYSTSPLLHPPPALGPLATGLIGTHSWKAHELAADLLDEAALHGTAQLPCRV